MNPLLRDKRTKKLAKEAKLAQKESNKCKVTAEEDLLLSIESIESSANANFNQLIAHLSAKFAKKTIQKRLKQNNCHLILTFVFKEPCRLTIGNLPPSGS